MIKTKLGSIFAILYVLLFLWLCWYKIGGFVLSRTKGVLVPFVWFVGSGFFAFLYFANEFLPFLKEKGFAPPSNFTIK